MKITKNFMVEELIVSREHPELTKGITPTKQEIQNATLLAQSIWQPARTHFDIPFNVLSWGRPAELNKAIGGSASSDHLFYCAADIAIYNFKEVFLWMFYNNLPYRQLILYPDKKFIHASCNIPGRDYKHESFIKYNEEETYFTFNGLPMPIRG